MPFIDRTLAAARCAAAAAISLVAATANAEEPSSSQSVPATAAAAADSPRLASFVTVLNASDLEERRITGLDGIAAAIPGLSYAPTLNSIDTLRLYMRGAGPAAPGQITLDGAVGV
jgi:hypothetical protein